MRMSLIHSRSFVSPNKNREHIFHLSFGEHVISHYSMTDNQKEQETGSKERYSTAQWEKYNASCSHSFSLPVPAARSYCVGGGDILWEFLSLQTHNMTVCAKNQNIPRESVELQHITPLVYVTTCVWYNPSIVSVLGYSIYCIYVSTLW